MSEKYKNNFFWNIICREFNDRFLFDRRIITIRLFIQLPIIIFKINKNNKIIHHFFLRKTL